MFYCFKFERLYKIFVKILIDTKVNISNELFFGYLSKCKLPWVSSKVYMKPFVAHSLRMQPNVVYTSINLRKMKFIP